MTTNHAGPTATLPPTVPLLPPPPVPPGWDVAPPDFVGVGAQRSGTTWWWGLLARHPRIAEVELRNKELHFFDRYLGVRDIDPAVYHRYFPRPPGKICGEWTPRYMYDFWVPPMLAQAAPRARLLVLLRDPVARYLSALSLVTGRGYPVTAMLLNEHLKRSLYAHQLNMLFRNFPRDQVLVLQYEACVADPVRHLRRTLEFLDLDPGQWQGESALTRRVSLSNAARPDLDPATYEALLDGVHRDLCTLFDLVPSLDPGLWPSAATWSRPVRDYSLI
ncbi:MAG TPA: sulfotransferase [Streptosporangiaceae bacterium]|jgi:hypothetical protein